jgi:hypothetical protein
MNASALPLVQGMDGLVRLGIILTALQALATLRERSAGPLFNIT